MNITFASLNDTGFLYETLKKPLERKGHNVKCILVSTTYLNKDVPADVIINPTGGPLVIGEDEGENLRRKIFKIVDDTEMFFLRWSDDNFLRFTGIDKAAGKHNAIFKVHGTDLRGPKCPYSLHTWHTYWYHNEPLVVGSKDWSLIPLYKSKHITCIERPLDFSIMPKAKPTKPPFIMQAHTGKHKKGTDELIPYLEKSGWDYKIVTGLSRTECLALRAKSALTIDRFDDIVGSTAITQKSDSIKDHFTRDYATKYGPYGMTAAESWYMKIPVMGVLSKMDYVFYPELYDFHVYMDKFNVMDLLKEFKEDPKPFQKKAKIGHKFVKRAHNPDMIAQQYLDLFEEVLRK